MIRYQKTIYDDSEVYQVLHPLLQSWFRSNFGGFSPPQKYGIIPIHNKENTLIFAPTGSGKTLTAFTSILNELIYNSAHAELEDRVYCVYISPLRALSRDIQKNLSEPLEAIGKMNPDIKIRVLARTGDTSSSAKAAMLEKPPHILITTPESLAILLTSKRFRNHLNRVEWVIVDEIHALASNKRGVDLSISLERLASMNEFVRIGLSATVEPLEEVAKYLVGFKRPGEARDCTIIDAQFIKKMDLKVLSPCEDLINTPYETIQTNLYKLLNGLIKDHRTTLIFTNTRSATERIVHKLKELFPKDYSEESNPGEMRSLIGAHHGSLSTEHRINMENMLKRGELKCIVSSTSLELGIDIGFIDLVILLGSPKSVARALQRIGRSGHKLRDVAKGRIIVTDRDDLVECAVLLKSAMEKKIDRIDIPKNCLDVLAQQLYGISIENVQSIDYVFDLIRKSYNYSDLTRKGFDQILDYLASEYAALEDRRIYAKIWIDRTNGIFGRKGRLSRPLYMTNSGTIPDESFVTVKLDEYPVGKIDELFLEKLKKGDVFVLGGETYEFMYSRGMVATVRTSSGRPPTVPSWFSEMLPLSFDLAVEIGRFRRMMENRTRSSTKEETLEFLEDYLYIDRRGANSIYEYFKSQLDYSLVPTDTRLLVEHYKDKELRHVVFHTLYGRRVNDVLSRALAYSISKIHGRDVQITISDNGFLLSYSKATQVRRAFDLIRTSDLDTIMRLALERTEVLSRRFRHCATRSLMILRNYKGRTKSVGRQKVSSTILLNAVRRISDDFPILKEARREVLEDVMDIRNARKIMEEIRSDRIEFKESFLDYPSPFAFNLVLQGYTDIFKMEDKLEFIRRMHQKIVQSKNQNISLEEFSYEKVWNKEPKQPDQKELLRKQLDIAYYKVKFDADFYFQIQMLLEGKREGYTKKFKDWLDTLLSGTVPYIWKDELVKFLKNAR